MFGRRPKAALKLLARHAKQRDKRLSELTRLALTHLKHFLEFAAPRPFQPRKNDCVHVFADACFEPGGFCGLGGLVFCSRGSALAWFGHEVQAKHVNKLLHDGDRERETVIFELEALAFRICLEVFRPHVERKGVVAFTDNEGVFGSFIRGHSDNPMCASLIDNFARCEESLETICWIERVPSLSNPADSPSRKQVLSGISRQTASRSILSAALPQVFG